MVWGHNYLVQANIVIQTSKINGLLGCSTSRQCAKTGGQGTGFILLFEVRPQLEYWVPFWLPRFKRHLISDEMMRF